MAGSSAFAAPRRHRPTRRRESPPVGAGPARPPGSPSPGPTRSSPRRTILVAVGEEPDPSILPEGAGIEVSGWAGIVADPGTLATGRAGIFAGGDVVSGPKTIIDAVASGRRAAASIHEYLAGVADGETGDPRRGPLPDGPRAAGDRGPGNPGTGARAPAGGPAGLVRRDPGRVRRADRAGRGRPLLPLRRGLRRPHVRRRGRPRAGLPTPIPTPRPATPDIAGGTP